MSKFAATREYADCRCPQTREFLWDTHDRCVKCTSVEKFNVAFRDWGSDGPPSCLACRRLPRRTRRLWMDIFCNVHNINAETGETYWYGGRSLDGVGHIDSQPNAANWLAHGAASPEQAPGGPAPFGSYYGLAPRGLSATTVWPTESPCRDAMLPPSGQVARDDPGPTSSSYAPNNPFLSSWYDESMEVEEPPEDCLMEPPARVEATAASEKAGALFRQVFDRAFSASGYPAAQQPPDVVDVGAFACGRVSVKPTTLPVYPPVDYWFKMAEGLPSCKPHLEMERKGGAYLRNVDVTGLSHRDWKMPQIERAMLPAGFKVPRDKPAVPTQYTHAEADKYLSKSWYAGLRGANLLSCVGMIADYLCKLAKPTEEGHLAAMAAAGVDLDSFATGIQTLEGATTFVSEVAQAAEAIGVLVLNAALASGQTCASATMGRRNIWLDALGYTPAAAEEFKSCPTSGGAGLVGCTSDRIATMKSRQQEKETVAKEMSGLKRSQPVTPSTGRGRGYVATNSANLKAFYKDGAPKAKSRGSRGRGRGSKKDSAKETTASATESDTPKSDKKTAKKS